MNRAIGHSVQRRLKLVLITPLLLLIALGLALTEGIGGFVDEFREAFRDIGRIWRGEI